MTDAGNHSSAATAGPFTELATGIIDAAFSAPPKGYKAKGENRELMIVILADKISQHLSGPAASLAEAITGCDGLDQGGLPHGRIVAQSMSDCDANRMRRAILKYLSVFDACGGSESVHAEEFAAARHGLREAVAEAPSRAPSSWQPTDEEAYALFLILDSLARTLHGDDAAVNYFREKTLPVYRDWHQANHGKVHPTLAVPSTESNSAED